MGSCRPHVEPISFFEGTARRIVVKVHQVVRDLKGNLLLDRTVDHEFEIKDGLVKRFDIHDSEITRPSSPCRTSPN